MHVEPQVPTRLARPDMADVDATEVGGDHGQAEGRHGGEMADSVGPPQRPGHRPSLEEMPGDRVRLPVSAAFDEGASPNPDQIASLDQGGHPVPAVAAVGQVPGKHDPIESDETKAQ